MIIYLPLLICIVGLLMYALSAIQTATPRWPRSAFTCSGLDCSPSCLSIMGRS